MAACFSFLLRTDFPDLILCAYEAEVSSVAYRALKSSPDTLKCVHRAIFDNLSNFDTGAKSNHNSLLFILHLTADYRLLVPTLVIL